MPHFSTKQRDAIVGDIAVLVLITSAGFATHFTSDAFGRVIVTTVGALLAWSAVAPFVGVYSVEVLEDARSVWRVGWAWLLAAPLATFLRGAILNRDIPWVFVVVTIVVNGFALVAWRIGYGWWLARRQRTGMTSMSTPR